ncbi:MAG TPA: cytochrome c3 family protein [Candidatus Eisenbacteria bacterium]|nr:cytochrome c3 family protein [Candidatus Eisenbacteria bacterium]
MREFGWSRLAAAIAIALSLLTGRDAQAQVSPGPLAAPHADLDTLTKCFACHSRNETMAQRCIACHTEIAWSRTQRRGLHARGDYAECQHCHPDHAGREFSMVKWDEGSAERFRHERTGYRLDGAHATVRCAQCHAAANQKSPVAPKIRMKDRNRSFLGLERACASCHADPHAGRFGATCETCHRTSAWKDLNASTFDHNRTRYPLQGRHALVACADCHDAAKAFGPKPRFDRCDACHRDVHAGKATLAGRPADCATCHDVSTFVTSTYTPAMHAKSAYPLEGRHRDVACASCHARRPAGVPAASLGAAGVQLRPKHEACADCHGNPHGRQLAGDAKALSCVGCHDLTAFKPARFGVAEHAKTPFPLGGAHARAACRACHDAGRPGLAALPNIESLGAATFAMKLPERACADCHADPHRGRFKAPASCADCHGVDSFRPARLGVSEHARYRFPLEGAHRAVPCVDCHRDLARRAPRTERATLLRPAKGLEPLTFAVARQECVACHAGPHGDQFTKPAARALACEKCHGVDVFKPATRFDHGRDTAFALEGAHRGVACARCHATVKSPGGDPVVRYRGVSAACESCHPVSGGKR